MKPTREYIAVLTQDAETGTFSTTMLVRRQEMAWILRRLAELEIASHIEICIAQCPCWKQEKCNRATGQRCDVCKAKHTKEQP